MKGKKTGGVMKLNRENELMNNKEEIRDGSKRRKLWT